MALLGRRKPETPITAIEREVSDLTSRRDLLTTKLAEANNALTLAVDSCRQSLLDADLSDQEASYRRDVMVRDARDRVEALADALQGIGGKIADAEQRLGEAREIAERREIAALARVEADELERAREGFIAATAPVITAMQHVTARLPNAAPDILPRVSAFVLRLENGKIIGRFSGLRANRGVQKVRCSRRAGRRKVSRGAYRAPSRRLEGVIRRGASIGESVRNGHSDRTA